MSDYSLQDYISHIERLDAENSSELINNSSTEHAIPLIARLFARGKSRIRLFTGSLNPKIYADRIVVQALGVFLIGRGGAINVLIQKDELTVPDDQIRSAEDGLISALTRDFGGEIRQSILVRRAPVSISENVKSHFLTVDDAAFRFEPDNSSHEAVASFNVPHIAEQLKAAFDGLFEKSRPIPLV